METKEIETTKIELDDGLVLKKDMADRIERYLASDDGRGMNISGVIWEALDIYMEAAEMNIEEVQALMVEMEKSEPNMKVSLPKDLIKDVDRCIEENELDITTEELIIEGVKGNISSFDEDWTDEEREKKIQMLNEEHNRTIWLEFKEGTPEAELDKWKDSFLEFAKEFVLAGAPLDHVIVQRDGKVIPLFV
jgi:hypothetical protein